MRGIARGFLALTVVVAVTGCTQPDKMADGSGIFDPNEAANRRTHEFNRKLDQNFLRPVAVGYSDGVSDDLEDSVSNFASNLGLPRAIVNNLLQGNLEGALRNSVRFAFNSTLGFGGLFDAAGDFGLAEVKGDFGQTLYVWGVPEGAYVEAPLFGPSTERDVAGKLVDFVIDPLNYVLPAPQRYYGTASKVAAGVGSRGRYAETVDSILYNSADSYAQARLIYLQNRRFQLGDTSASSADPYTDPYEDPYE